MSLLNSFNDFYINLSSNGLFFFWIVVFLFVFLIFLLIVLYVKNKKLIKLMKEKKKEEENLPIVREENLPIKVENDLPLKEENKIETKEPFKLVEGQEPLKEIEANEPFKLIEEPEEIKEIEAPQEVKLIEEKGPYTKNILREMNTRMQTSPISIKRDEIKQDKKIDLTGIDYGEDNLSPLEAMEDAYEVNDNMRFASEIVGRMEEEIKPSNIELTDYEKKQEEEAIISYDELQQVKDKIYNITEEEETDEFIDELKNFRIDLN